MISPPRDPALHELYRQLFTSIPMLAGREITVTTTATGSTQYAPHGLGRAYRGALQLWTTAPSNKPSALQFLDPSTQGDSDVNLAFVDALGYANTVLVWVWLAPLALLCCGGLLA